MDASIYGQNEVKNEPNREPNGSDMDVPNEVQSMNSNVVVPNAQPVHQRRYSLPFPFNVRGRRPSTECRFMNVIKEEKGDGDDKKEDK